MKIAIIGAMEEEIVFLKKQLVDLKELLIKPYVYYTGKLFHNDIVLVKSGVGKVSSGGLFSSLVDNFKDIDIVFNVGVSGGIKGKTKTGDVIISEKMAYHDADVRSFGYKYGQMAGCPEWFYGDNSIISLLKDLPYKKGTILTGDIFMVNSELIDNIINEYFPNDNVLAVDMETTAFAQMAYLYNKKYLAVRVISDVVGENSQVEGYNNSLEYACQKSNEVLIEILKKIK